MLAICPKAHRSDQQQAVSDVDISVSISNKLRSKQRSRSNPTAQDLPRGGVEVEEGSAFPSCCGGSQARRQQSLCTSQVGGRAKQYRKTLPMEQCGRGSRRSSGRGRQGAVGEETKEAEEFHVPVFNYRCHALFIPSIRAGSRVHFEAYQEATKAGSAGRVVRGGRRRGGLPEGQWCIEVKGRSWRRLGRIGRETRWRRC